MKLSKKNYKRYDSERYLSELRKSFLEHFVQGGLTLKKAVDICDAKKVDSSVRFVGALTNVWKKNLLEEENLREGFFLIQECFKSNNLSKFKEGISSNRTSVVELHGFLMPYDELDLSLELFRGYFKKIGILGRLVYQVSSKDIDILESVSRCPNLGEVEVDTLSIDSLRHQYGHSSLKGRDIRVSIKSNDGKSLVPFAVLSVVERNNTPLFVEMTYAPCRVFETVYGLEHALDTFPLGKIFNKLTEKERIFEDCLIASIHLFRRGLRPGGSENKRKILRKYIKLLKITCIDLGFSSSQLKELIQDYEMKKFGSVKIFSDLLSSIASEKINQVNPMNLTL